MNFLLVRKSDNFIAAIEKSLEAAELYNLDTYKIVVWKTCNSCPKQGTILDDTRTYSEQRKPEYQVFSDKLFLEYQGQNQDGDSVKTDLALNAWLDKRTEIRTKYPKP